MSDPGATVVSAVSAPGRIRRVDARRNLEAILDAARRVLPERPDASMQDIAAEAGVHRATVHRHFPSRDDLVAAVRARAMGSAIEACARAADAPAERAVERVEAMAAAVLEASVHYRLYRFTTWRDEQTAERSTELRDMVVPALAEAQAQGDLRADLSPEDMMIAFGGLLHSVQQVIDDDRMTVPGAAAFIRTVLGRAAA